uniref:Lipoprotein n=1 Tax=uncultured Thiotrichaceae bacterium TaxID=298394 RepID=A0A6S6UJA3_9GAMM|nr:MAG: Unknown protein [uncultured Thiotrichaceae bacterium]
MRSLLALPLIALLTASCATTSTGTSGKTDKRAIESVIFVKSSPPVSATLRRDQTLTINKDLSARLEIKDGYNKLLNKKAGTITAQQFKTLTEKLNEADYTRLRAKKRDAPLVGSPTHTLVVKSDQGAHRFIESAMTTFPTELEAIFAAQTQYVPTAPVPVAKTK